MAMEEKSAGAMTRRGFLTALGLAGASAAGAGLVGCAPKQPTEAAGDDQTALADTGTLVETDIPEEKSSRPSIATCAWSAWAWRVWEPCVLLLKEDSR